MSPVGLGIKKHGTGEGQHQFSSSQSGTEQKELLPNPQSRDRVKYFLESRGNGNQE
jgi:hypothetical protein